MTKAVAILLLAASVPALTGCYGPFRLTSKLHSWNGQISNQKFVNELAFLGLGACRFIAETSITVATSIFFIVPVLLGIGFGVMFPAMNSLYVNLAPNNQRATATSTYLTAWDVGIGIGILTSGFIAHIFTFYMVYLAGSVLCVVSLVYFVRKVTPHYNMNKLR